jgi:hypothetical protein
VRDNQHTKDEGEARRRERSHDDFFRGLTEASLPLSYRVLSVNTMTSTVQT